MKHYNRKTLLVNFDHFPLRLVGWKTAVKLIFAGKARQIEFYKNDSLKDGKGNSYPVPAVIILTKYVHRNHHKARFSKMAVFSRDHFTCGYCSGSFKPSELTMDHIIPKSRWKGIYPSKNWTNIITACKACNWKKADRTCEQSGMYPNVEAVQPTYNQVFLGLHFYYRFEPEWETYLQVLPGFKKGGLLANSIY